MPHDHKTLRGEELCPQAGWNFAGILKIRRINTFHNVDSFRRYKLFADRIRHIAPNFQRICIPFFDNENMRCVGQEPFESKPDTLTVVPLSVLPRPNDSALIDASCPVLKAADHRDYSLSSSAARSVAMVALCGSGFGI